MCAKMTEEKKRECLAWLDRVELSGYHAIYVRAEFDLSLADADAVVTEWRARKEELK
jgi:hypothetical protein